MEPVTEAGLKFVERCAASDAAAAAADFLATIRRMGFACAACGAWAGIGRHRQNRFFFVDWPQDWLDFYQENGFVVHDALPIESRRRVRPFWYSEVVSRLKLSAKQKELYDAGVAYGWKDVFGVPIHGPGSLQGLVTMATRQELKLSLAACAVLEAMARAVWERCRTAEGFGLGAADLPKLTAREIECLQWAAAGKSDADIATLVGIKPPTAHFHVERAKKKLGVRTRVEAVAVGVLHGVI
jgi:DNA-binding CsgD family transcriptional regulator/alkylhydroperoxidase/carboxymuconolactone decarboxylase family protein YurZ